MAEHETFLECLERRFNAGARTLVMTRPEAEIVIKLLKKKETLDKAAMVASKFLERKIK